ncbi:glycoside hydrolase family 16 protein [Lutibacter sp. A80]|uniref:glycoside hydrolase family 16 protein n=1 Tax=Lutibacter sp. A80 TaxID=2918453 RepID=UPI001F05A51F|nr:glycoside hydrolase family 16 protein [Lutibacter sp. A80]UMB59146.1 glycoside hydrolase family 16 protein [Lutibacter sp. A80]
MLDFIKNSKLNVLVGLILIIIISCGSEGDDSSLDSVIDPEVITPSNLLLTIDIVGLDSENPNGDGTGVVYCTASATDAVKYEFKFGNGDEITNTSGSVEYQYTDRGTNNYIVSVIAFSKTGDTINTFQQIKITVQRAPFDNLIFFDEFDIDGSPDDSKWGYNIGTGDNGWGNGEKEYYTDRAENVIVEDGFLKITAIKENYEGAKYTSARMLTQDKFEFTYGRVEVRAKLPFGSGTWPAIWMLGANIDTVGWPACGEIDIMEHWGYNHGTVQSALHTPSSYGSTTNHGSQLLEDVSNEFHVYTVEWDDEEIVFSVDDKVHYTYSPATKNDENWPYTADQFLILNVAMGGSWFEIDPNFTESSMIVDYVRVYQ